jgi:hypothetical protein
MNIKIEIKEEGQYINEHDSDLHISINNWLLITPFKNKEIHYSIQKVVTIPGIHMRFDGTGEPDDVDIVEIEHDIDSTFKTVEKAIHIYIDNELNIIGENFEMEVMIKEEDVEMVEEYV